MSDLESFSPSESSEGVDAGALDRLREQMKEAAKAMKSDQKQEQKQKKTEDAMYKVLVLFIDSLGATHPVVYYSVKCLSDNILSELILCALSLNYPTIQQLVGLELIPVNTDVDQDEQALIVPNLANSDMPLSLRLNIEIWIKLINNKAFENPLRNLNALKDLKTPGVPKHSFTDLMSYIAQDYLQSHQVDFNGLSIEKFIRALIANLIERLEAHVKSTQKLENPKNESTD